MENNNDRQLRIGVIGIGPVGGILLAHLIEAGAFVVACDVMRNRIASIKKSGLRLTHGIEKKVEVVNTCCSIQELEMYDLDVAIITAKTPALPTVISHLAEIASDTMYVLCAQNGIDNELEVARAFSENRTLRMVINFAGNMSDINTVHVSFFHPPNYIAALTPEGNGIAGSLTDLLNSVNLGTEIPEDIQDLVWEKAILNSALSGICAITRRTMKEVMDYRGTRELVEALIDESVQVAAAEGFEFGKKFRRFSIGYLKKAGHHRPSMLIDLDNGLKTEIDSLNGKIMEYGRKHYSPTPLNQAVTAMVHLLEKSSQE
ncbi:MAG: 2-dehydropantoate 2-reductase [Candidatus Delongbacteria bacterium]|nr:2-dehydropantoate 2-reductase [Candidatus Delongbacteria bacterium]